MQSNKLFGSYFKSPHRDDSDFVDKEQEEREYQERRRLRRQKLQFLRKKMKIVNSESQIDKYAFYFEG